MHFTLVPILFLAVFGTRTYYSPEEALRAIFPDHKQHRVLWQSWEEVPTKLRQSLIQSHELQDARVEGELVVYEVLDDAGRVEGWAIMTEEMGKHQPITMMVGILPGGEVKGALLMRFRENRGYGIKHPKFQSQFAGKTQSDPIEVGIDIVHVSGSTISSRSMARAVRKALWLVDARAHAGQP